jgi:anti-anti-sigma factor
MRDTAAAREPVPAGRPAQTVGSTIARLQGNLNITTAPALREHLIGVLSAPAKLLVIDLSGVSSSDAAGLAVLIGIQRRARARGSTMRLAAPCPQVAELLQVTGLDSSFTICATVADACPGNGTRHLRGLPSAPRGAQDGHPRQG